MLPADTALLALLAALATRGYRFTTITPASHARALADKPAVARSLTDIFGWSLPFAPGFLPTDIAAPLAASGMLDDRGALHRSHVRVSMVAGRLFLHSAYPTSGADAVFLGPDSYRFAGLLAAQVAAAPLRAGARVADIGVGTGVGAIAATALCHGAQATGTDPNPQALRLARVNAAAAGVALDTVETSGLAGVDGPFDLILTNPPYVVDPAGRTYRDGGGLHGGQLSIDLAREALEKLAPGGRLILYTGSAIVDGEDRVRAALTAVAGDATLSYRELDPDVFGEELGTAPYAGVDRIAVVAAIFTKPD
ncbi:methyltransferase [Sphingomonas sp.]|uniref:methyltransferase n=1 Tax=Sphingomonas sp. TaxID=28214 RepID=UPI003CC56F38